MTITTIPLTRPVPLNLASEFRTRLFFVSPEIQDFSFVEREAGIEAVNVATVGDPGGGLADKINHAVETEVLTLRAFKPKIIWRSKRAAEGDRAYQAGMFDTLVSRGLAFEAAEGQVGFAEPLIGLIDYLDRKVKEIALAMPNAQEFQYPTLLPTSVLDTFGYFGSFPHFAMFVTRLHNDIDVYEAFRAEYADAKRITGNLFTHCGNHDYCLPPTMCYHTYHQLRGSELPADRVVTAKGKSFRFEAKYYRGLERLWDFTIREIVFLGSREFVVECRESFMRASFALMDELGLSGFSEVANDPFFVTQDTAGKIFNQRMMALKYELRMNVDAERTIAAASFNLHERFFGDAFKITGQDRAAVTTGCVGFGLERLAYAFLCQNGLDEAKWPEALRTGMNR